MTGSNTGHSVEGLEDIGRDPNAKGPTVWELHKRKCPEQKNPKSGKGFIGVGTEEGRWVVFMRWVIWWLWSHVMSQLKKHT